MAALCAYLIKINDFVVNDSSHLPDEEQQLLLLLVLVLATSVCDTPTVAN
eukprot:COSAG01_NODE_1559_length_9922_cov_47.974651_3_plen_50_part_00